MTLEKQSVQIKELTRLAYHLDTEIKKNPIRSLFDKNSKKNKTQEVEEETKRNTEFTGTFSELEDKEQQSAFVLGAANSFAQGHNRGQADPENVSYEVVFRPIVPAGLVSSAVDYYLEGCPEDD